MCDRLEIYPGMSLNTRRLLFVSHGYKSIRGELKVLS